MAGKNTAAFAIFTSSADAERAVDSLVSAGFSNQDVSVLMPDKQGSRDFATEKNTKAPEGTTTGVVSGGAIGGTLGLLAGIGALAIPGLGPFIAAGPIMATLAGLGVGGSVGGLVGALVGMGIPEYEAKRYEGRVKDGGVLVSVHCDSSEEVSRAKDVLRQAGGQDVASAGEKSVSTHGVTDDVREGAYDTARAGRNTVDDLRDDVTGTRPLSDKYDKY
jgi:rhodanese-related sulfurtransferase